MRIINADKLYIDCMTIDGKFAISQSQIANAPTIPNEYMRGYEAAEREHKRPTGEWDIVDAEGGIIWDCVCTECGHDPQEYINGTEDWWLTKSHLPIFCPNCGARILKVKGGEKT